MAREPVSDFKPSPRRGTRIKKLRAPPPELILGYTRTGRSVLRPMDDPPDGGADDLADWTKGDHVDAAHILKEHCDRESDRTIASWCKHWARAHKALGGR